MVPMSTPPVAPPPATALAPADPAARQIEVLYPALRETMRHGKALGASGRAAKLKPILDRVFAFGVMAQFAVGPRWATLTADERRDVTAAMERYTVRSYANNFDHDEGVSLVVEPQVGAHGLDKLVKTMIVPKSGQPTVLSYRMRSYDGEWKVVDVYYDAVSQIAAQRSEFTRTLGVGGAGALVRQLDAKLLPAP